MIICRTIKWRNFQSEISSAKATPATVFACSTFVRTFSVSIRQFRGWGGSLVTRPGGGGNFVAVNRGELRHPKSVSLASRARRLQQREQTHLHAADAML